MKTLLFSLLVTSALALTSFLHAEDESTRFILVSGSAVVRVDVDQVMWGATVRGESERLEDAAAKLEASSEALKERLTAVGEDISVRTSYVSSGRIYEKTDRKRVGVGYFAERSFIVKTDRLGKTPAIDSALLADEAIEVNQFEFESSKHEEFRKQAISEAVDAAKEKAEMIADQLGVGLGEVLSVSEGNGSRSHSGFNITTNRVEMPVFEGSSGGDFAQIRITGAVTLKMALR